MKRIQVNCRTNDAIMLMSVKVDLTISTAQKIAGQLIVRVPLTV